MTILSTKSCASLWIYLEVMRLYNRPLPLPHPLQASWHKHTHTFTVAAKEWEMFCNDTPIERITCKATGRSSAEQSTQLHHFISLAQAFFLTLDTNLILAHIGNNKSGCWYIWDRPVSADNFDKPKYQSGRNDKDMAFLSDSGCKLIARYPIVIGSDVYPPPAPTSRPNMIMCWWS